MSFWCLYCQLWTCFTTNSSVSNGNFWVGKCDWAGSFPASIYLRKVINRNTRTRREICSKLILLLRNSKYCSMKWISDSNFWIIYLCFDFKFSFSMLALVYMMVLLTGSSGTKSSFFLTAESTTTCFPSKYNVCFLKTSSASSFLGTSFLV